MEDEKFGMKDSGERDNFNTGAVREERGEDKGRYDLISPIMLHRLAIVMQKGADKYCDRNWEKGMPVSRYMDSALRHLNQYLAGKRDEDHLAQAIFNVMGLLHTEEMVKKGQLPEELMDLPNYEIKKIKNNGRQYPPDLMQKEKEKEKEKTPQEPLKEVIRLPINDEYDKMLRNGEIIVTYSDFKNGSDTYNHKIEHVDVITHEQEFGKDGYSD